MDYIHNENYTGRVFFALALSSALKHFIATRLVPPLKQKGLDEHIRWTETHNLHITLAFLATLKKEDCEKLILRTQLSLKEMEAFSVSFGRIELFPDRHHPEVIALAIPPHEKLLRVVRTIASECKALGYPTENRPYRGHITLGRVHKTISPMAIPEMPFSAPILKATSVILFQSKPTSQGSLYIPLAKIPLLSIKTINN